MSALLRILLIFLLLIYILIPYDILPDFFPIAGWIDDIALLGLLLYYFRYGKNFFSFFKQDRGFSRQADGNQYHEETDRNQSHQNKEYTRSSPSDKSPYEILGIPENAGPEKIRAAYRQAAQSYHPDKVTHLGPEFRELAQKKFIEIQKAYETLMTKHGG